LYYEPEPYGNGVVSLSKPGPEPLILDKITRLCAAVRPSSVEQKLVELNILAASGDLILAKEAEDAKKGLQKAQLK